MKRLSGSLTIAVILLATAEAQAQSKEDLARADALFNAGKALTDAGQFADACAKFAESKRLAPGLGVTLYLADCYEHIGRTASAWNEFRSAEGLARARNDKRADVARARAQGLEPKLFRMTIAVSPTVPLAGLQVLRDGVPVSQEEWGLPLPVDPGDHVVFVSAPGHKSKNFDVRLGADRQTATVQIDRLDDGPPPNEPSGAGAAAATAGPPATTRFRPRPGEAGDVPSEPPATTPSSAGSTALPPPADQTIPSHPDATRRWIGLGAGGLGVVGIAVGSAFGVIAMSKRDQSNNGTPPPCDASNHCTSDGLSLRQDAKNAANVSTVAFIAGGIAVAAGVVLYVTAPRGGPSASVVVVPTPTAGGAAALLRATF